MKKYLILMIFLCKAEIVFPHCQVPCGIYDDALRIMIIKEDFSTIDKAITKIDHLSKNTDAHSLNQINRWIDTKDEHASNIQKVVSDYFLTQRIKETNKHYLDQLKFLHQILVSAMKCKQGISETSVAHGLGLVDDFSKIYFDEHGLEHLKKMSK